MSPTGQKSRPKGGEPVACTECGGAAVRHVIPYRLSGVQKVYHWIECKTCKAAEDEEIKRRRLEESTASARHAKSRAGIKGLLQERSFEGFVAKDPGQRAALAEAQIFAGGKGSTWLAFCGATGTGKSHLAGAIVNQLIESGWRSVCYVKVIEMMRRFRATFHDNAKETEQQVAHYYQTVALLALDEFGVRKELTEWERMTLDDILDCRWEQQRRTLIVSNMTAGNMFKAAGERIESRFAECGQIVNFTWGDHRKSHRKECGDG